MYEDLTEDQQKSGCANPNCGNFRGSTTASMAIPDAGALAPNPGAAEPKPDGGPAFPFSLHPEYRYGDVESVSAGMTLRDYFAGQSMQGLLSVHSPDGTTVFMGRVAECAVKMADELLAELAKA